MGWSEWFLLEKGNLIEMDFPECDGLYEIRVNSPFPRLKGTSRVVNIGRTNRGRNLRSRMGSKADYQCFSGPMKWLHDEGDETFEIRYMALASQEDAKIAEDVRISQYPESHWELPPANGQGPGTDPASVNLILTENQSTGHGSVDSNLGMR